jgi:uncharacterized protein (DUF885 family)
MNLNFRRGLCVLFLLSLGINMATSMAQSAAPSKALHALFASEWERKLSEHPEFASYQGVTRYNDRWTDMSLPAIAARDAADRRALQQLRAIARKQLNEADQLHYDTFEWQLQLAVQRQAFREHLQPISHQGGVQTADGIAQTMPFNTVAQVRQYLARMASIPAQVDQTLALMQAGVQAGLMPPRVLMTRVPAQIAAQLVTDATQSPFYRPFKTLPASVPEAQREPLAQEARSLITERIVPAYRKLQVAFERDYLPHTRGSIAATALPDGAANSQRSRSTTPV